MVLYGGVSLAIYMSGVAQELLAMVRATAPGSLDADGQGLCRIANEDLRGTEAVYRRIAQRVDDPTATDDSPVRVRFVVDIISGSSAGGLNGVFLAKALATGKSLDSLNDLWIEQGDMAELLDDERSLAGFAEIGTTNHHESLLNGDRRQKLRPGQRELPRGQPVGPAGRQRAVVELVIHLRVAAHRFSA